MVVITSENILEVLGKALRKLEKNQSNQFNCEVHKRRRANGYYYGKRACSECMYNIDNQRKTHGK